MAQTALKKVIHFSGSLETWNLRIDSGNWKDCIVFGEIENPGQDTSLNMIYGGQGAGEGSKIWDYEFQSLGDLQWDNSDVEIIP